ncbi:MAG: hypothetical protein AAB400_00615 [Patescibacteria group bacterium]
MKFRTVVFTTFVLLLSGCAGMFRSCSNDWAETAGADWIVIERNCNGTPVTCYKLKSVSVTNEPHSDGIQWNAGLHMMHVSGWYNRVQVHGRKWDEAAQMLGIDANLCGMGTYPATASAQ